MQTSFTQSITVQYHSHPYIWRCGDEQRPGPVKPMSPSCVVSVLRCIAVPGLPAPVVAPVQSAGDLASAACGNGGPQHRYYCRLTNLVLLACLALHSSFQGFACFCSVQQCSLRVRALLPVLLQYRCAASQYLQTSGRDKITLSLM